jgi:hypothetical protein
MDMVYKSFGGEKKLGNYHLVESLTQISLSFPSNKVARYQIPITIGALSRVNAAGARFVR